MTCNDLYDLWSHGSHAEMTRGKAEALMGGQGD